MKKKKKKNRQFRLGVEYALLMINKYVEKKKPNAKTYSRKKKHRNRYDI